jgi:hypothetical protein
MVYHQMFEVPVAHEINGHSHLDSTLEFEDEWETYEHSTYANPQFFQDPQFFQNSEADQFLPLLAVGAKIAGKLALKGLKKAALKGAKKLISRAPKVLNQLNKLQRLDMRQSQAGHPSTQRVPQMAMQRPRPSRLQTARSLVAQLRSILGEGESQAAALEAQFFGVNEFEGELANHDAAHEIALTEVLAAEAAHTTSESEAEALLGAALPITLRAMGGSPMLRRATPSLLQANVNLVRNLHRQGQEGRPFLRIVSAIHRRTIASLQAVQKRGGAITPELVSQIMRAHTSQILRKPQVLGPTLIRNFAIRRAKVSAGR